MRPIGGDGASKLEEAVAECAFAMIDMGHYAEIPVSLKGYGGNAPL